jgi:hypothetical protein
MAVEIGPDILGKRIVEIIRGMELARQRPELTTLELSLDRDQADNRLAGLGNDDLFTGNRSIEHA